MENAVSAWHHLMPFDAAMRGDETKPIQNTLFKGFESQPLASGAEQALRFQNEVRAHEENDPIAHQIRVPAEDVIPEVVAIQKVMERLVAAKSDLFRWPSKIRDPELMLMKQFSSPPRRGPVRLATDFLGILQAGGLPGLRQWFPKEKHQFHPLVELFERHMEKRGFWINFRPATEGDVKRLNACVEEMRKEARSEAFRSRVDKHHKLVRNNTRSVLELVEALFAVYSQLLVVRIDLSYRRNPLKGWLGLPVMDGDAFGERSQMIRYLQRKCPCRPVGYAWKTEWAEHTGWHTHLLLFFDANHHQNDITIARMLGKHWDRVITRGKGRHHISNLDPHQECGVGKIRYSDAGKLWALVTIVVPYLTKADYYVRLLTPSKTRTFGRSGLPRVPTKKLGRPRLNASARVSGYTGLWNRPGYSKRKRAEPRPKLRKHQELTYRKHLGAEQSTERPASMDEYQAMVRARAARRKIGWQI